MIWAFRIFGALVGAFVGLIAAYFPAAVVACLWLMPDSNLCGLPAALMAAPLGLIVGAVVGWFIGGRIAP